MDPTAEEIMFSMAVDDLQAIPYFPREPGTQVAVQEALMRFVLGQAELTWLVLTAVDNMREWRGVAELRALYSTRWRPLDGIEGQSCSIAGYTPSDCEAQHAIEARSQKFLPAPEDTPITEAERKQIEELAEKCRLQAGSLRPRRVLPNPSYLENS